MLRVYAWKGSWSIAIERQQTTAPAKHRVLGHLGTGADSPVESVHAIPEAAEGVRASGWGSELGAHVLRIADWRPVVPERPPVAQGLAILVRTSWALATLGDDFLHSHRTGIFKTSIQTIERARAMRTVGDERVGDNTLDESEEWKGVSRTQSSLPLAWLGLWCMKLRGPSTRWGSRA
jgi:hypothetical protein